MLLVALAVAVTNGAVDAGDAAVMMLAQGGKPVCSGILLTPRAVLTAAHCMIDDRNFDQFTAGGVPLIGARMHPLFDGAFGHDLALVILREASTIQPLPLDGRAIDASLVGQSFTVVGFGSTSADRDDAGVRRSGTALVTAVGELDFTAAAAPSQPCAADSGGPALFLDGMFPVVTGVVSHGDAACADHAVFTRVDQARADFIDPQLQALAPGSAGLGERCYFDEQCRSGPCLVAADEPRRWYCSRECTSDGDCGSLRCIAHFCRYQESPGALGTACAQNGECVSGLCNGVCTSDCQPTGGTCPGGFVCKNIAGIQFECRKAPPEIQGGCAVGGGGDATALMFAAWWLLRRRVARIR